jgi:hypothetical protein
MQEIENIGKNSGKYGFISFFLYIYQCDDLVSVQSRGKQCVFYQLISAVLTDQNIPLIDWSKTTLSNVLLQGHKMYLQALD